MRVSPVVAIAMLAIQIAPAQTSSAAAKGFSPCQLSSMTVVHTERLPERPMVRTIETSKGEREITMTDGYRVLYTLGDEPMLNMKMETLQPSTYAQQKSDLLDYEEQLTHDKGMQPNVATQTKSGVDSHVITRNVLEGGVLSIAQIFNDSKHELTTIYLLNAEPERRHFKSIEEFAGIRDRTINEVMDCMLQRTTAP